VLSPEDPLRIALARRGGVIAIGAAAGLCLLIWIWRRPEQLTRPYVWDEESVILERFVSGGWLDAFRPVNGYLILPANVLVPLAAEISFPNLPPLMYAFSTFVFLVTLLILLLPDSRYGDLPTRALMALTMSLAPVNPEVFGVLLYSFWWSTLWPLIIVGWQRTLWPLRAPLLAVATLSSPAGGALSVVFLVSYLRGRRRRDLVSAAILVAGLILQLFLFLNSSRESTLRSLRVRDFLEQVLRTGGFSRLDGFSRRQRTACSEASQASYSSRSYSFRPHISYARPSATGHFSSSWESWS
jgi:hypothetical protein